MKKRFSKLLVYILTPLCVGLVLTNSHAFAESVNYCHDEQTNKDWEKLAHNNSEPEIKELYRLRRDLCEKVDAGDMDLDTAIDVFESQRQSKIRSLLQRKNLINEALSSPG